MTRSSRVDMPLRELRGVTVLAHLNAENRHDIPATLATFRPGAERTMLPGNEIADGHAAVVDAYRELFTGFPDMHFDIAPEAFGHQGDRVIFETVVHGTHRGPFRGLPPTGRRLCLPIVTVFEFDGADLVCERVYFDRLTLFIQLGVGREPTSVPGKLTTILNHPVTVFRAALRSRRRHTIN
ncbi:ester cyclase [Mycobacterium sp. 236(2023)]|uniref:ester cyclase n=1 Tax=Mycobacterium sp. 236(2023) TaxID=3038163 RepID=UPI002415411B|nr:ester cyclase [Mycobacterium sp. 236(2023)]MDG4665028.1 ester cyclase [Mycobacterium sp. 236(2023)]